MKRLIAIFVLMVGSLPAFPQIVLPNFSDYDEMSDTLSRFEAKYANMHLDSLAESANGRKVWVVEIGDGSEEERSQRPALLVVGGVEGNQILGSEIALSFLGEMLDDESESLHEQATVYVIPRLNPDAIEQYFETPRMETTANSTPHDDDNDALTDEDGPEDLNNDNLITWIRVEDPEGQWIEHPDDNRILINADPAKGEQGKWLLFSEGHDNDEDEEINEDPVGGTNLNNNFPFEYPWFDKQAGRHSVSETETRALADFVVEHPNIAAVMVYSNQDNLLKTPESGDRSGNREPQTKIVEEDIEWFKELGQSLRDELEIDKEVRIENQTEKGTIANWMYFHRGRLALTTLPWSPEMALAMKWVGEEDEKKTVDEDGEEKNDSEKEKEKRGKTELEYLQWLDKHTTNHFADWHTIEHPDFPDQEVEVGGFFPFAKTAPHSANNNMLEQIPKHVKFLKSLVDKLPQIKIDETETKHLGKGVYELNVRVVNQGYLPTILNHGERTGEVHPTRVEIGLPDEAFLAGQRVTKIEPLSGSGGFAELQYIIKPGSDRFEINVISAHAGRDQASLQLQGGGE